MFLESSAVIRQLCPAEYRRELRECSTPPLVWCTGRRTGTSRQPRRPCIVIRRMERDDRKRRSPCWKVSASEFVFKMNYNVLGMLSAKKIMLYNKNKYFSG